MTEPWKSEYQVRAERQIKEREAVENQMVTDLAEHRKGTQEIRDRLYQYLREKNGGLG